MADLCRDGGRGVSAGPRAPDLARLLRRLAAAGRSLVRDEAGADFRVAGTAGPETIAADLVRIGEARGLLAADGDGAIRLTDSGWAEVRRRLAGPEGFAAQHQTRVRVVADGAPALANADESPLAGLARRRGADGRPLLDIAEVAAGERLRADFTRGQIAPRVTANWSAAIASGRRSGDTGGIADLTDAALGARLRVERALVAVGPEFSGLLVDFCCFLKGLEEIERERRWPARAAKLVLRLGLSALARHYGLEAVGRGRVGEAGLRHWGAAGYRPSAG